METILTKDELSRITTVKYGSVLVITIDLHELSGRAALRLIKNLIALHYSEKVLLKIIHGYRHGTVIKEHLWKDQLSNRPFERQSVFCNPGMTLVRVG